MSFVSLIGYHEGFLEVKVIVKTGLKTKKEAEQLGNSAELFKCRLYDDRMVIGSGRVNINIEEEEFYQFRVCFLEAEEIKMKGNVVSEDDYKCISWKEALEYLKGNNKSIYNYFNLEAYYYITYEEGEPFIL